MKAKNLSRIALAVALAVPAIAAAESQWVVGPGNASARLDFQITIPRILYFQIGAGAFGTNNGVVTSMTATVPAANLGDGTPVSFAPALVPVRVAGNNGQITIAASTVGALGNGAGDTISFATITPNSTDNANLPSPPLADGPGAPVNVTISSGTKVTDRSANWSFAYSNAAVVPPGTYGGIGGAQNSTVTYTAAMP
ncbi:MAG: hypothetical protein KF776_18410 [Burkholderiales bacterium]|nr:hypothetical protein [Burkholderiales bacterium]